MAKKFLSDIELDAGLVDVNGNTGTSGQILSSTGTSVDWINQGDIVVGETDKALSLTLRVKNTESVALTKGQAVCAAPTETPPSGNVIEVKLADNDGTDSMPAIGILNEGLDAAGGENDEGEAIMFGRISGIDTSAFSVGDEVFVSDTPGVLTTTKPTGVKYIQKVGVVMRDDASNGTIEVFGAGRTNDVPTPLYVDHLNQRIGIGEENPSSQLHINNDVGPPKLTLSYAPSSGYGGGGDIRIEGGSLDYVYGGINWYNGGLEDARLTYSAASRQMSFAVNQRGVSSNGYFRFYEDNDEIAEINSAGIYGNAFYDQGDTTYYLNPASTSTSLNVAGDISVNGGDIILGGTGRIQGIDTVSAGTDAVNKNYVDNNFASSSHDHDSDYVNVTGDTMTGPLGIGITPTSSHSLQTSNTILTGSTIYIENTSNSIFDYFGTLHIYAGNGNNITLGGGIGSIQNDVSIGNGTFRVNGSTRMGSGNPTEKLDVDGNVKADGFTSDGNAYSYTWRALDNTAGSGTRYQKIARVTSSQSTRFIIELAGRSISYGDNSLPAMGYIVGQLNNDNNYDLVFYNHSGEDTVVNEVGQVDVSTTATDIYIKVADFSEVTANAHISDGSIAVESTSAGGTEPANYLAATNITVWNSRNDGGGSGLDADLLDNQQGTYYLDYNNFTNTPTIPSAYNHPTHPGDDINLDTGALSGATVISDLDFNITTDTLGHVTDANATYSTRNITAADLGIVSTELVKNYQNVNYVASDPTSGGSRTNYGVGVTVYEGYSGGTNRPHTYDATVQFMPTSGQGFELSADWVSTTTTPLKIRSLRDCCNGWSPWVDVAVSGTTSSGTFSTTGDYRAPRFYDYNNTSYYVDLASTSIINTITLDRLNMSDRGDFITFYGDDNTNHSISSRDNNGSISDDLRVNSYHNVYFNLDSNNNNTTSSTGIYVGQHGGATGTIANAWTFYSQADGITFASGSFRAPIFYDSNDTAYYVNPAGTSTLGFVNFEGYDNTSGNTRTTTGVSIGRYTSEYSYIELASTHGTNRSWIDFSDAGGQDFIHRLRSYSDRFGIHSSSGEQFRVFSTYTDSVNSSRAPIFYDSNNTAYYVNPDSHSHLNTLTLAGNRIGFINTGFDAEIRVSDDNPNGTGAEFVFYGDGSAGNAQLTAEVGNFTANVRTPTLYDSNNTAYYVDPASTSVVNDLRGTRIWAGYDANVDNSISCSDWFRSSGSSGWFNATYSGGIHMQDSTWVRVYNNKKFYNQNTIESNTAMYAPIFYDRNNTNYRFHGDLSHNNVDLTSSGNYAIHVAGTISGGHRRHVNLETPEMEWSVGGSTDLNWKKLCDVVISDAGYSGWGAEIEITDFSGNFGNAAYNGGELFKGALSIYHWGGTGYAPETAYANIPYEMAGHVRWYKINESGQNRYQLQVKSPANYRQLYVKVKPGIGNQVADIISYANDTNGATSGGTITNSVQNANFNHEFAGGIWTNDTRTIGWKNSYGNPHLSSYYGTITTSGTLYVGGPSSTTTSLYSGYSRASVFYDRNNSAYYMDGNSTGDSIRVAGDVVAYYSSDKRYKDNIKPIENALDKVKAINGVTFNWNEKSHKETGKKDVGVIAQEVEEVLPEIVQTRDNGYKAVDYQKLTAVLIESVKELTAKVEALEAKQCNCK